MQVLIGLFQKHDINNRVKQLFLENIAYEESTYVFKICCNESRTTQKV